MSKTIILSLAVAAGALSAPAWAADANAITAMIREGEMLRKEAARLEYEWRWTGKYLKDAQKALDDGKLNEALTLATRGKREAELAIEQAAKAEVVWQIAVPK